MLSHVGLAVSAVHDFSGWLPVIRLGAGQDASFELPTYFLIISLTLCLCVVGLVRRAHLYHQSRNTALDLALVAMIGGFLGSRLLHVIFEEPRYYLHDPIQILHVERGGFVWYGGLLFGFGSGFAFALWRKLQIPTWLDVFAPLLAFGYAMGRVACWLTGCCFGDVCILPSGFSFRYPTQIFAVAWESAALFLILRLERRRDTPRPRPDENFFSRLLSKPAGLFWAWLLLHAIGRIIMESFRADDRGPLIGPFSISMLLSAVLLLIAGLQILKARRSR